ncbi:hypothetical protein [Thalassotalea hakodatensis]|uniref:hypothetical protein n=1 Tax=Thalassotalea hakodatensis TaxID=3030492 RepID=UPI0025722C93|nr:hypothetical protein [Thalassotalea hakodatensis]
MNPPNSGGYIDSFFSLADSYLKMRDSQYQADVTGAGQAQLNNTVEQPQGNGQVPLTSEQLSQATNNTTSGFGGLSTNQLVIGAAALAAVFLIAKK